MLEALYKKKKNERFTALLYIIIIIFFALVGRLIFLQIIEGAYYSGKAEGNRLRVLPMTAARGIIYDRNGQILAGSRPAYTVSIMPDGHELNPTELTRLAEILKLPTTEITKKVSEHKGGYEPIRLANDVGMDIVTRIEEHRDQLPGISIDVEPIRYYPYN